MVSKRSSDEARQAAREVRKRRERRKKYEALIEGHATVKAVRARMIRPAEKVLPKRGVPKLIAEAMQDRDVATAINATRRVMKYHHRTGDLARRRLKRERIPLKEQIALIRQGENIERDFREMFRSAIKAARANPATEAYAAAIANRLDDTEVLDKLPSFFSRDELAAIKYLGIEPQELSETWDGIYTRHRQEVLELIASGKLNEKLEGVEKLADRLEFPEAPRHLVQQGVLTLGGDARQIRTVAVVVAAVVAVVVAAPVVFIPIIVAAVVIVLIPLETDFMNWYNGERDVRWAEELEREYPCPCELPVVGGKAQIPDPSDFFDPSKWEEPDDDLHGYHSAAKWGMRSKAIPGKSYGQQCCYSEDEAGKLKLITGGASAGTPDKHRPADPVPVGHFFADVDQFNWAKELDGGITPGVFTARYLEVRPPSKGRDKNGNICPPNRKDEF